MDSRPKTYRKIRVINKGSLKFPEQTEIVEVPVQQPGTGEVLIRVLYTGIESSDILQNAGVYGPLRCAEPEQDKNGKLQIGDCGCEGVGEIIETGAKTSLKKGDVVVFAGPGMSFREFLTCSESLVIKVSVKPSPELTAIPISAATAACALDLSGHLKTGDKVIVTGAAGGAGQFAVQWAKVKYNAYVVGVCGSAEKADLLSRIGCDDTINYREETDLAKAIKDRFPQGINVAYDAVGGALRPLLWENLAVFGRLICIGGVAADYQKPGSLGNATISVEAGFFKSLTCSNFFIGNLFGDPRFEQVVEELVSLLNQERISAEIDPACRDFRGLEGVYSAQDYIRSGNNAGKVYVSFV